MSRFIYTIVSFVILSGFGVWYVINNYRPTNIFIIVVCFLFFIFLALICSIIYYFYNLKQNKIIFPYEYRSIYRNGLFNSFLISLLVTLILSFQLLQILDLVTLILLIAFFVSIASLRSGKVK